MTRARLLDDQVRTARAAIKSGRIASDTLDANPPDTLGGTFLAQEVGSGSALYPVTYDGEAVSRRLVVETLAAATRNGHRHVAKVASELLGSMPGEIDESIASRLRSAGLESCAVEIMPVSRDDMASQWIQLTPLGTVTTKDGRRFIVDEIGAKGMVAKFADLEDDLVVDYDHSTFNPSAYTAAAAGWIEHIDFTELGVFGYVRWTERARQLIESREYRYISPVLLIDDDKRAVEIINAALVNVPAIDGMMPLAAKREAPEMDNENANEILEASTQIDTDAAEVEEVIEDVAEDVAEVAEVTDDVEEAAEAVAVDPESEEVAAYASTPVDPEAFDPPEVIEAVAEELAEFYAVEEHGVEKFGTGSGGKKGTGGGRRRGTGSGGRRRGTGSGRRRARDRGREERRGRGRGRGLQGNPPPPPGRQPREADVSNGRGRGNGLANIVSRVSEVSDYDEGLVQEVIDAHRSSIADTAARAGVDEGTVDEILDGLSVALVEIQDLVQSIIFGGGESADPLDLLSMAVGAKTSTFEGLIHVYNDHRTATQRAEAERDELRLELARRDAGEAVDALVASGTIHKAQREWAVAYALDNPDGFETFANSAPTGQHGPPMGEMFAEDETIDEDLDVVGSPERVALRREVKRYMREHDVGFGEAFEALGRTL